MDAYFQNIDGNINIIGSKKTQYLKGEKFKIWKNMTENLLLILIE